MTNVIPSFLASAFDKRIDAARVDAEQMYDEYWSTVKQFVIRPCFDCGSKCKVETEQANDKYAPSCRVCSVKSYVDSAASDLSDRMSVC